MPKHVKVWTAPVLLLAVLGASSACASRGTRLASRDLTFCARSSATLYVQNDNWLDIVLYAVRGGSRFRLGQVSSIQSAKFELPMAMLGMGGGLHILADPVGVVSPTIDRVGRGNAFLTDDIMLAPGHTIIDLRLDNIIDHSSYSVAVEDPEDI